MVMCKTKNTSLDYAFDACNTIMKTYGAKLPPVGRFHYHAGVFLLGVQRIYEICKDEKYFDYIKKWVDTMIDENGVILNFKDDELDDLQAGNLLFLLYDKTGDSRYKKALDTLVSLIPNWKRNAEGGLWHKGSTPDQMWLDGIYMAGPLCVEYGARYNQPWYFKEFYKQLKLMEKHMKDPKTGLYKHGWDCEKIQPWADPETGVSEEYWGRAMGWYVMALLDMADHISEEYKQDIIKIAVDLIKSLINYQDEKTGLWYQVVDKGYRSDNWHEVSCSALYTYGICKAIRLGYLEEEYKKYAEKAYEGIIDTTDYNEEGDFLIQQVCIGTGISNYNYYVRRPISTNDLHGVGAFLLMCAEYYKLFNH